MIKNFRFCPKCASENIQFDNHKLLCNNCGFVFYQNTAAACALIVKKQDEILFTVRNKEPQKGKLDLPGGFVDPDETVENACIRELKEELNLDFFLSDLQYFESHPNTYLYKDVVYKTADMVFIATVPDDANIKIQEEEIQNYKWIKIADIHLEDIGFDSLRAAVANFIGNR